MVNASEEKVPSWGKKDKMDTFDQEGRGRPIREQKREGGWDILAILCSWLRSLFANFRADKKLALMGEGV